jgi:hypothetical protein
MSRSRSHQIEAIEELNDAALLRLAFQVNQALELRGLPDVSFKEGFKAGFIAALRDENWGPGQVWTDEEAAELFAELERQFVGEPVQAACAALSDPSQTAFQPPAS